MKHLRICIFIFSCCFLSTLSAQQEALDYMEELSEPVNRLKGETWQYLRAVTKGKSTRKVESKRQKLLKELQNVRSEIIRKERYEGGEDFYKAVINYLELSRNVLKEDYDKILNMEIFIHRSYDQMEAYLMAQKKANEKLDSAFLIAVNAQQAFAKAHQIKIQTEEDRKTQKINKASLALQYHNQIYLVFYKAYLQETFVLQALQDGNARQMEQHAHELQAAAQEGLSKLKSTETYQSDGRLRDVAKELLAFYKHEAERSFPNMVNFYYQREGFEKLQQALEAKDEKERTKADIDAYNEASANYNRQVQSFNTNAEADYNKRVSLIEKWNHQVEAFFEKHAQ